jgi:glycosyltransferase involved in cell wall biosynthesis
MTGNDLRQPGQARPKRVLMLAYFYPPVGGAGVQRSAKFAKYLPDFGWEPYVISTPASIGGEEQDDTLLADLRPAAPIWRVPTPQTFVLRDLKRRWRWIEPALQDDRAAVRMGLRGLLFPFSIAESPPTDPYFWWSLRIIPLACKLVTQYGIDIIYTTMPPWSTTLAGRLVKHITGRPLVVDFRDPWTHNDQFAFYKEGWRSKSDRAMEAAALRNADRVITVMSMDDLLEWRNTPASKSKVIYNGYDRADFDHAQVARPDRAAPAKNGGMVRMLHLGTLYPGQYSHFVQALATVPCSADGKPVLELRFVGDTGCARGLFEGFTNAAVRIAFTPRVSHPEAIETARSADVLLILNSRKVTMSKLYEYLASGTPILAVVPPGSPVAEIVAHTHTGYAVNVTTGVELAAALREISQDYAAFRARRYAPDQAAIEQFERRALTGQLAGVLDQCLAEQANRKARPT